MKKALLFLGAFVCLAFAKSADVPMSQITTASKASVPNIEVSGTYVTNIAADCWAANIHLSVTMMNRDSMYMEMNAARAALYDLAHKSGFSDSDVEHQSIDTEEQWRWEDSKDGKSKRVFVGYNISQSFCVRNKSKKELLKLLNATKNIKHLSIDRVTPQVRDSKKVEEMAKKGATAKALEMANIYAAAANSKVGRVLYIADGEYFDIRPHHISFYQDYRLSRMIGGGGGIGDATSGLSTAPYDENSIADSLEVGNSVLLIVELKEK